MYEHHNINDLNDIRDYEEYDSIEDILKSCALQILSIILGLMLGCLLCICCASCSPKVVTNTITQHDTLRVMNLQHDSINVHDSVYIEKWLQGDTVYISKYNLRTLWRDRWVFDTVYQSKADTISQVKVETVEKKLSRWQKMRLTLGDVFLALLAAMLLYLVIRVYRFWRSR